MRFAKYKMSSLNEALLGNCNIEDSDEVGITAAVDPTYAKAINDRKVRKEKAEANFKDSEKLHKDFVADNHKREVKTETTKEMKAMKLAEEKKVVSPAVEAEEIEVKSTETSTETLTEAVDFGDPTYMSRGACTPLAPDFSKGIQQYVKHLGEDPRETDFIKKGLNSFAESLFRSMEEVEAFNDYWTARYPAMIDYINNQLALIPEGILDDTMMKPVHEEINEDDTVDGLDEFLDANISLDASGQSVGLLGGKGGQVINSSLEEDNDDPHFFAVDEETLNEAPVATEPKKRARAENEVKYQRDYSSEDLWLAVYDELSSDLDNEGAGQQVDKQLKAKRGERYENVYPHGDSDIIIYATDPSEFEFAKKVAQHYGVTCREPVEDTNPSTNGHYKWSMVIEIPEDELFDSAFKPLHNDDEF